MSAGRSSSEHFLRMNEGKDLPPWPFYDHGGFLPPSPKQMKTTEKQMYISKPVQPLQSNQPKAIPPMNITPNYDPFDLATREQSSQ